MIQNGVKTKTVSLIIVSVIHLSFQLDTLLTELHLPHGRDY
jgi:hypothetical protein